MKQTSMRAAVLQGPARAATRKVPIPEPQDRLVRVRLEGCGVCGSNLVPWEGRPWFAYPFEPGQPGHEGWGVVDAVGDRVTEIRVGDRVALLSTHAFAEYDLAREDSVVRLPDSLKGQPFPGEALGCAMNIFLRSAIARDETVAILGIGFLGACLTALASRAGARVVAITRRPFALEIARRFGAAETIQVGEEREVVDRVRAFTHGEFCDCVIEAVGAQWSLDLSTALTRESGRLVIAGYHQDGGRQVNMQLWNWRGLEIVNAHERRSSVNLEAMRQAAAACAMDAFDFTPLYSHRFSIDAIGDAFTHLQQRPAGFMKALITL